MLVVVAIVSASVVVARDAGDAAVPRLPKLGPARDIYDGDLGDPFILPVTGPGQEAHFVAFGTGDWPARVPTARSSDLTDWQEGPTPCPSSRHGQPPIRRTRSAGLLRLSTPGTASCCT